MRLLTGLILAALPGLAVADDASQVRAAVSRALEPLQRGAAGSAKQRQCFTCHSQAMPVFVMVEARRRGFSIDEENLETQVQHTHRFLKRGRSNYENGRGQGGGADTAGYALWTLEDGEAKPDDITSAVASWLLSKQTDKGFWKTSGNRPPSERSNFTTTYVTIRALENFAPAERSGDVETALARASTWVSDAETTDTEDRVFQLLTLARLGLETGGPTESLLKLQREDGGWAQTSDMSSDAYATGTVLYALQESGLDTQSQAYQRGVRFLLEGQLDDGTWHVVSRSKPFQTYFETGFPHEKDQFISSTATAWATLSLLLTLPEQEPEEPKVSEGIAIWPGLAPGETSDGRGEKLPPRGNEAKPINRVKNVRLPTMDAYLADNPNGTGVLILPGGGFRYVVPNLEGSEAAEWLNRHGVSAFVLRYRTQESAAEGEPLWKRPAQDAQRALRVLRSRAKEWKLDPGRIGLLAFSAGGQVGAIVHSTQKDMYEPVDDVDEQSARSDFAMLVYPWRVLEAKSGKLLSAIQVSKETGPAFIVHTHDDGSTAVGAARIYIALKEQQVPAELHIYQNGGHGYGLRPRERSVISTWPDRATDWLRIRGLLDGPLKH